MIESGPDNSNDPTISHPALFITHLLPTSKTMQFHKGNKSDHLSGREPIVPTANVLGGGSSVNFLLYSRAQRSDFDSWQVPGWSAMELLPYMRKVSHSPLEKQRSTINNLIVSNVSRSWP